MHSGPCCDALPLRCGLVLLLYRFAGCWLLALVMGLCMCVCVCWCSWGCVCDVCGVSVHGVVCGGCDSGCVDGLMSSHFSKKKSALLMPCRKNPSERLRATKNSKSHFEPPKSHVRFSNFKFADGGSQLVPCSWWLLLAHRSWSRGCFGQFVPCSRVHGIPALAGAAAVRRCSSANSGCRTSS